MNDLKKRIDDELAEWNPDYVNTSVIAKVIKDCRAEIERLEARIAELEKPYVGMSNKELYKVWQKQFTDKVKFEGWNRDSSWTEERQLESEVIKRYSEQRGVE